MTISAAVLLLAGAASAQEIANFSRGQQVVSPEVYEGGSVTFRLAADYATTVYLSGNWMDYTAAPIPMTKGPGGVWETTVSGLEPEIYTYNFIVDGVSVNDPVNFKVQRDGTRYLNMVFIPGERSAVYNEAAHRGTLTTLWYDSAQLGLNRRMIVYTPYGYEDSKKTKYPVLYLLHGGGGDEEAWTSMGRAAQILDNLIERGEAVPMIVVMPNGNPNQQAAQTLGLGTSTIDTRDPVYANAYVKSLVTEIIPFVEKRFRVIAKPSARAISGLSMGGGHTLTASQLYPSTFDYICPLSISSQDTPEIRSQLRALKNDGYRLYFVGVGNTDFLYEGAQTLDRILTEEGLQHVFYVSEGGHEWKNWRLYLQTFAKLLFK
jgi:enterochelin esterase family protein